MFKLLCVCGLSCLTAGCGLFDVSARRSEEGPVVVRAFFSNEPCSRAQGVSESGFGPEPLTLGITKAAELAVGYVTDAVAKAAEADKETFTMTGQNPDYLFSVQGGKAQMRGCLYIVAAPRVPHGEFCAMTAEGIPGSWYNRDSCKSSVLELNQKWEEWSLGTPTFYAEISFRQPEGGPDTAVIPEVKRIYYPRPISTMSEDKVKGFSILVSASKPTKSTRVSGDTVLEVFLGGDGVTPKTVRSDQALQTSGLWVVVPAQEGGKGESFAGPVNLTVTVAETPNPTAWLQAVAGYVAANKQKAIDLAVAKLDPVAIAKADAEEAATTSSNRTNSALLCSAFSTEIEKLTSAKQAYDKQSQTPVEEKRRAGYALYASCEALKATGEQASAGWKLASRGGIVCGRDSAPESEVNALCANR